ncbi:hypothetical protein OSB04_011946 [Centaurea solstitialis]|uniref:Retrovirus-related Pol polyprotein from transposon TNT 1-94-like beta-barrel domain-containing protein n=1 Tax=Centaurea solstitialis TaxID=347529 RepID=A0AA38WDG9_9ASTR|nr:hypothetical protein OSB04_011946 [Centaurea solstitialis]
MTGNKSLLINYVSENGPSVTFGDNVRGTTKGYGTLTIGSTTINKVAYVEGLMHNILSISQLCVLGYKVKFDFCTCFVVNDQGDIVLSGKMKENVYVINMDIESESMPDIMFSTCLCARFQADPKESHLNALKRIFRYLKGTPDLGLWYPKDSGFDLIGSAMAAAGSNFESIRVINFVASFMENGTISKPPRFNPSNFSLWKSRMILFMDGIDSRYLTILRAVH